MKILIGDGSGQRLKRICQETGMGRMLAQNWPDLYENEPWGFDNGAFGFWKKGLKFDEKAYSKRLNKAIIKYDDNPYIAIVPDIVAGGMESLKFSLKWLPQLPPIWPWYLAVQDGMEVKSVLDVIDYFSGIFLGGTDDYKKYAGYWCKLAHHCGKKFHYGRVGTLSKLAHAIMIGADSLDSAFPLWTKDRLFSFIQALSQQHFDGLTIFAPHPDGQKGKLVEL